MHVYKNDVPSGTSAMERSSIDMDAVVRVGNEVRSIDVRFIEHHGRVRRVQALGTTDDGVSRFRVEYLSDGKIKLVGEERSTETSPVDAFEAVHDG